MRKFVCCLVLLIIFSFGFMSAKANVGQGPQNMYLFNYQDYQKLLPENIMSLKILRYTEGGIIEKNVEDKIQISQIYNHLSRIKIQNESQMSCTDNATIYSFGLKDGSKVSVEIECEWVVIKGKNYNFKYEKGERNGK